MIQRRVWAVHMVRLGLDPVERGYVGIGWMQLGDLAAIPPTRAAYKAAHVAAIPDAKAGAAPLEAGMLFRFVHEMELGDVLVYPCREDRMIYLGEVTGSYKHVPSGDRDPNRRAVRWLKALPRSAFPAEVQKDFGNRSTLVRLKPNAAIYVKALEGDLSEPRGESPPTAAELARKPGQGFGLRPAQRKLVEEHAMERAAGWLKAKGFSAWEKVAAIAACDYVAERGGHEHVVEVKGTTGELGAILLTANEMALHRDWHPRNLLIVVHGILLSADSTHASGGEVTAYDPWIIDETALTPTAFSYALVAPLERPKKRSSRLIKRKRP